ncbi:MAG: CDP-diacylglycerol--glycerol-3-phosphate 3-phosphatidyltransferase [Planctomycetota bacterium]
MAIPSNIDPASVWNVPNRLSGARIVMAVICFGLLAWGQFSGALAVFVLAAATDWLDGYWARRFGQITQLGRILDPFADKLLICGVFVYLAASPGSGVPAAAAVIVLGRELLVTALRSFVESGGGDFSAKWAGKWKMVLQCATVVASLLLLAAGEGASGPFHTGVAVLVWATVALTLYSAVEYIQAAAAIGRARSPKPDSKNAATTETDG